MYDNSNSSLYYFFFFFNDTATTEIYTLSLHDALPIYRGDLPGGVEAEMLPRLAGVDRLVDAVAFVDGAAGDQVAHADVDHVGVGGGDFDGTDRGRCGDSVEDRGQGFDGAGGLQVSTGRVTRRVH